MAWPFILQPKRRVSCGEDWLQVGAQRLLVKYVRDRRARRYVLRLLSASSARITLPWRGSMREAREFAMRQTPWLQRQLLRHSAAGTDGHWDVGRQFLFRGETVAIERGPNSDEYLVRAGLDQLWIRAPAVALKLAIARRIRKLAQEHLPVRARELAQQHGFSLTRVTVRNQRSRWGSCSRRGGISLNWRLLQMPAGIADYIIFHELAHLRHLNHSRAFWTEVERLCPGYVDAERWIKANTERLREL